MRHVVIGAGQVGDAIAYVLGADLVDVEGPSGGYDVMHVCFPWFEGFEDAVWDHAATCHPNLTIIHSTVPVGTSSQLGAVHSPVTGKHPNLVESLRTFVKFFGGARGVEAAAIFSAVGVSVEVVPDAETTEAGKLWATLQYGWLIALEKEARRFCLDRGADPQVAYRRFNEAYNTGYAALGEPHRLPILDDMAGPIGGHCVIPNAALTPTRIARVLVQLNGAW